MIMSCRALITALVNTWHNPFHYYVVSQGDLLLCNSSFINYTMIQDSYKTGSRCVHTDCNTTVEAIQIDL